MWQVAGSYLEACNCEAICPCRRIGGTGGGRSTYGECLGALSWMVSRGWRGRRRSRRDAGGAGESLPRRRAPVAVDVRAVRRRRAATSVSGGRWPTSSPVGWAAIRRGSFPWVFKPAELLGVEAVEIEIDHTPGRGWFRAGGSVEVRVREPVASQERGDVRDPGPPSSGPRADQRDDRRGGGPAGVLGSGPVRVRVDVRLLLGLDVGRESHDISRFLIPHRPRLAARWLTRGRALGENRATGVAFAV